MEDLPLLYREYFTHEAARVEPVGEWRRRSGRAAGAFVARLLGVERERDRLRTALLAQRPPGRVLDVGCGDGRLLIALRELGWEVEGCDVDPWAVERARKHGLAVGVGRVDDAAPEGRQHDAVTLVHVLEHDPDPLGLLADAWRRVLRGGVLVVVTPNLASLGHRVFRAHWPGLDPPRHLVVFSPAALRNAAAAAGIPSARVWTSAANAERHAREAFARRRRARGSARSRDSFVEAALSHAFQIAATGIHRTRRESGEELVLEAVR